MKKFIFILMIELLCHINLNAIDVKSSAFKNGEIIPSKYTCDGKNVSIPLNIENFPKETKSFAVIMDDPDAPIGTFIHWVIYNIPSNFTNLPENIPNVPILKYGILQGRNDFGKIGYGGPCPPNGTHRYFIKVYALDKVLNLNPKLTKQQLLNSIKTHIIEKATIIGLYSRIDKSN